jgi:AcrR family transcriptional regulator
VSLQAFRETQAQSKRSAIMQAASRLFAEHGFREVSTAALAAAAGVSTATLYRYFPDKESIFGAVIDELVSDVIQTRAVRSEDSENRLRDLALRYADLLSDPLVVGLIRAVVADRGNSSAFGERLETQGNGIFEKEFETEIRALLKAHNSPELDHVSQASRELRGVLEHNTLLPELLFHVQPDRGELPAMVDQALDSWSRRWIPSS